jgi:hypothetical protein
MQPVQATRPQPTIDRILTKPIREELPASHNPMLPPGELGNPGVRTAGVRSAKAP